MMSRAAPAGAAGVVLPLPAHLCPEYQFVCRSAFGTGVLACGCEEVGAFVALEVIPAAVVDEHCLGAGSGHAARAARSFVGIASPASLTPRARRGLCRTLA